MPRSWPSPTARPPASSRTSWPTAPRSSTSGRTSGCAIRPTTRAGTASSTRDPELLERRRLRPARAAPGRAHARSSTPPIAHRRARPAAIRRRRCWRSPRWPGPASSATSWSTPRAASRAPGATPKPEMMFGEVNESVKAYGLGGHRHVAEIEQELAVVAAREGLDPGANPGAVAVDFVPHLDPDDPRHPSRPATSGRPARSPSPSSTSCIAPPTRTSRSSRSCPRRRRPSTRPAATTCWSTSASTSGSGRIIAIGVEDNLVKGAAGQAVQAFNLVHGLPETAGLEQLPLAP